MTALRQSEGLILTGVHPDFPSQGPIFVNFAYNLVKKFFFPVKKCNLVKIFNHFLVNSFAEERM